MIIIIYILLWTLYMLYKIWIILSHTDTPHTYTYRQMYTFEACFQVWIDIMGKNALEYSYEILLWKLLHIFFPQEIIIIIHKELFYYYYYYIWEKDN